MNEQDKEYDQRVQTLALKFAVGFMVFMGLFGLSAIWAVVETAQWIGRQ